MHLRLAAFVESARQQPSQAYQRESVTAPRVERALLDVDALVVLLWPIAEITALDCVVCALAVAPNEAPNATDIAAVLAAIAQGHALVATRLREPSTTIAPSSVQSFHFFIPTPAISHRTVSCTNSVNALEARNRSTNSTLMDAYIVSQADARRARSDVRASRAAHGSDAPPRPGKAQSL
jgi:hypothetical protein